MQTLGSAPSVFECSDGETYYIKHIGNNRQHVINELIGASLLQFLELPTPEIALVEVVPDTVIDEEFDRKPPQGLAFGSRQLKGQFKSLDRGYLFQRQKFRKFAAYQALVGIVLFDIWVYNIDRAPRNPNVLVEEIGKNRLRLVAIDHAVIFEDKEYSSLGSSRNNLPPTIEESLISHPLFPDVHDSFDLFISDEAEKVLGQIESITEEKLHDILNIIPDEWDVKDTEKESIIKHYLLPRKELVRGFYQQLLVNAKI